MNNSTIFDFLYPKYKIKNKVRLIEFFAGYGSQAMGIKRLGLDFEHWKICEWAIKSIQAYKDIHFTDEKLEINMTKEEMIDYLYELGISNNYNEPMTKEQIKRLSEDKLRTIVENIKITHNLVNIQKVKGSDLNITDVDKYDYILTYSFPCQDLSRAGLGKGMSDTSTRSGMLWEVIRILTECKELGNLPQVLIMENVPLVHGVENLNDFNKLQLKLEQLGYKNYWQDLIATDYGIPQTRNRCFMVSILGDYNYVFPKPIPLKLKLKDMLEDEVDEKYYLSNKATQGLKRQMDKPHKPKIINTKENEDEPFSTLTAGYYKQGHYETYLEIDNSKNYNFSISKRLNKVLNNNEIENDVSFVDAYNQKIRNDDLSGTISTGIDSRNNIFLAIKDENKPKLLGGIGEKCSNNNTQWYQQDRIYDSENVAICISTTESFQPNYAIKIKNNTKQGFLEAKNGDGIDISSRMESHRGTVQKQKIQTLTTKGGEERGVVNSDLRIRKLTPKECFRLMGVSDEDFEKCARNQSNASLYHLAGDSIVVDIITAIIREMI